MKEKIAQLISNNVEYWFPNVASISKTLKGIIENKKSIARFGDGEFATIYGRVRHKFQTKPDADFLLKYHQSNLSIVDLTSIKPVLFSPVMPNVAGFLLFAFVLFLYNLTYLFSFHIFAFTKFIVVSDIL